MYHEYESVYEYGSNAFELQRLTMLQVAILYKNLLKSKHEGSTYLMIDFSLNPYNY